MHAQIAQPVECQLIGEDDGSADVGVLQQLALRLSGCFLCGGGSTGTGVSTAVTGSSWVGSWDRGGSSDGAYEW